jgi:hypothetical protein
MGRLSNVLPARMKEYIRHLAAGGDMMAAFLMQTFGNGALGGASGLVTDPTVANSQATGAGGTLVWNVDISHVMANFRGVLQELGRQASVSIHNGATPIINGNSIIAAVVLKKSGAGVLSIVTVKGTAAAIGSAVPPTDAAIQTAVGAGLDWVKLADVQLDRTSDLVVAPTYRNFNGDRGVLGVPYPY